MPTMPARWSSPTSGAGRSSARRTSASPGTARRASPACASRSPRSTSRQSRASSARGSSHSRPPGCSAPRRAGTSTSRGPATDGSRIALRWKASSRPGGSITPSPSTGSSSSPGRSCSPGARASASCARPPRDFPGRHGLEAPIGLLEPEAAQELLQWLERRRQIAGQKVERPSPLSQGRRDRGTPPAGRGARDQGDHPLSADPTAGPRAPGRPETRIPTRLIPIKGRGAAAGSRRDRPWIRPCDGPRPPSVAVSCGRPRRDRGARRRGSWPRRRGPTPRPARYAWRRSRAGQRDRVRWPRPGNTWTRHPHRSLDHLRGVVHRPWSGRDEPLGQDRGPPCGERRQIVIGLFIE